MVLNRTARRIIELLIGFVESWLLSQWLSIWNRIFFIWISQFWHTIILISGPDTILLLNLLHDFGTGRQDLKFPLTEVDGGICIRVLIEPTVRLLDLLVHMRLIKMSLGRGSLHTQHTIVGTHLLLWHLRFSIINLLDGCISDLNRA